MRPSDEINPTTAPNDDFRMRLRFRVVKSFYSKKLEESIVVDGRMLILKSCTKDEPLDQAKWVIAGANSFRSEPEARKFGKLLKRAIQFAALESRNGVDCGQDMPTSGWGASVKAAYFEQSGMNIRDDIHGIDVFRNDGTYGYMTFSATGQVFVSVDPFLKNLAQFYPWMGKVNQKVERLLIMMNGVLMNREPVAQIVLALSTIEGLGQDQELSDGQKQLLVHLASIAAASTSVAPDEAAEIEDAVLKIHKLSLRQGVLRLLRHAGLDLKSEWDGIYKERSTLVHGLAPQPGVDYGDLAHRTISLCVRILHRLIEMEIGTEELGQISLANYK
jgi:hypothetical protein